MKICNIVAALISAAAVVGCGGGGDPGKSVFDKSGTGGGSGDVVSDVSNAKATQKAMSFSASDYQLNWGMDGDTADVTIRISDTAGNPLPKDTLIQFSVSGGSIIKTCLTGADDSISTGCSVQFTTQNPRPSNGLVAVVAWLIGEEAYKDLNGNGKYDSGEPFYESGTLFRDDDANGAYTPNVDELVVASSSTEGKVGVGTQACHQDAEAQPTEVPMSVPNTCDGVWGKTLVRAVAYFAVSDARRLGIESATTDNSGATLPGGPWVRVFTLAPDGTSKVAAVSGTTVTAESSDSACTLSVLPTTSVSNTSVYPTYHRIVGSGCAANTPVTVKATSGDFTQQTTVILP
jgi:hypothetical protein